MNSFLLWAAQEPYTFLLYVLIGLSPFLCISAILSYKLSKELKKQVMHSETPLHCDLSHISVVQYKPSIGYPFVPEETYPIKNTKYTLNNTKSTLNNTKSTLNPDLHAL